MKVELINSYGSDEFIAKIAGISYDKEVSNPHKLIPFLLENGHLSPFEHCSFTFLIECPLFVRSQIMRHRTFSFNEMSRRYVGTEPQYDKSGIEEVDTCIESMINAYNKLLECTNNRDLREKARYLLPQSTLTKFYLTADLRNLMHFFKLRMSNHAQKETRAVAYEMYKAVRQLKEFDITFSNFVV